MKTSPEVSGFKGFDKNLKCRGHQFKVGETHKHDGKVKACSSGFHFCEHPLDVFSYYPPGESRFASVRGSGDIDREGTDTKVACSNLHIEAEVDFSAMVKAAVKFVFDRAKWTKKSTATEENEGATESSPSGAASATGPSGAASATGDSGAASATGYSGAASATGDSGAASATGDSGAASATGYRGAASATGPSGAASATGPRGAASATGDSGAASATGYRGAASATGYRGAASATGPRGAASATGPSGAASATGDSGAASATGKHGVASALGIDGRAKGAVGVWLVISEWKRDDEYNWYRDTVKTVLVDGKKIKADTFYKLTDGKFVEA
jgi:hypothetical protein